MASLSKNFCIFFFLVVFCRINVSGGFGLEAVTGLLEFGLEIYKIIDGKVNNPTAEILSEMETRIDAATTKIITTVLLQSKLERIDDAVIAIRNSLTDLEFIIKATSNSSRSTYETLFVKRFDNNAVEMHLRFLPELLKYNIPGTRRPLLDLFVENTRCNMTAINDFETFYLNLVSAGIATEFTYLRLSSTSNITISDSRQYWTAKIDNMNATFTRQIDRCKQQFEKQAYDDVVAAADGQTLWENNNLRYAWLRNNVFFLKTYVTNHFLYIKFTDNYVIRSNDNKIVLFTEKNERPLPATALSILNKTTTLLQASVHGYINEDSAANVGKLAELYLLAKGYALKALLVFFVGDIYEPNFVKVDPDSQLIQGDVAAKMQYCYGSDDCQYVINGAPNINSPTKKVKDTLYGKFKIFAYVDAATPGTIHDRTYKTATGNVHLSYPIAFIMIPFVIVRLL